MYLPAMRWRETQAGAMPYYRRAMRHSAMLPVRALAAQTMFALRNPFQFPGAQHTRGRREVARQAGSLTSPVEANAVRRAGLEVLHDEARQAFGVYQPHRPVAEHHHGPDLPVRHVRHRAEPVGTVGRIQRRRDDSASPGTVQALSS